MNRAERPLSAKERLAEPTMADIRERLTLDARLLAERLDGYCGPVDDRLAHELDALSESARDLCHGETPRHR